MAEWEAKLQKAENAGTLKKTLFRSAYMRKVTSRQAVVRAGRQQLMGIHMTLDALKVREEMQFEQLTEFRQQVCGGGVVCGVWCGGRGRGVARHLCYLCFRRLLMDMTPLRWMP